ncbi:hypothetical protein ACOME3_004482 [Neoechinorhynchus agilis]
MGSFLSRLWSIFYKHDHKVIIVGLDNAGKSTILYQFFLGHAVQTSPTIGSNTEEIRYKNTNFIMWDIGGQESQRSTWPSYFGKTEFVILVVDSQESLRLPIVKSELHKMLENELLSKAALLVFANKQDLKNSLKASEISLELGLTAIKDRPWHIQPCCALSGEGLVDGLEWIVENTKAV